MTTNTTTPAAGLLAKVAEAEALAAAATPGEWEWSDCFDPEGPTCGMVEVRIPSKRPWGEGGYDYLQIADMEWATSEDLHTAEFIAASRTLVPALAAALRACIEALDVERLLAEQGASSHEGTAYRLTHALDRAAAAMEASDAE